MSPVAAGPTGDFTALEIARGRAFHHASRRPWLLARLVALLAAATAALTPWPAELVGWVARPVVRLSGQLHLPGAGWLGPVVVGTVALVAGGGALRVPTAVWSRSVAARFGLVTGRWRAFWRDAAVTTVLGLAVVVTVMAGVYALVEAAPGVWWVPAGLGVAALVVVGSLVIPVVVEPMFNRFAPMPDGPLRTELLQLAGRAGVRVGQVLVADASRRSRALNAYVSGLGATRRIVVYDTLLAGAPPEEVVVVVAHELGHVRHHDVARATAGSAVGAALAPWGVAVVMRWSWLLGRTGVGGLRDGRSVVVVLGLAELAGIALEPLAALLSRRTEARADRFALHLTGQAETFARLQRRLAVTNLVELPPPRWERVLVATHPDALTRIQVARAYAASTSRRVPGLAPSTVAARATPGSPDGAGAPGR
ncbi:MAG: M48 family metallopeptidase [Actinomycetes bacterium]